MGFAFGSYSRLGTRDAPARLVAGASNIHIARKLWSNKNIMTSFAATVGHRWRMGASRGLRIVDAFAVT